VDVTVEEIDAALHRLASICRFSSPAVKATRSVGSDKATHRELDQFYQRLSARDAKWLTRLVLKTYEPVILNERVVFRAYHVLLPQILNARADFIAAVSLLRNVQRSSTDRMSVSDILNPVLSTKIGRQVWLKGRGIKHCATMIGDRDVSCEQKIDGEYCQIHIDLQKSSQNAIQIFSKSGKDSTEDRKRLHR
jgi:DNA ligase 4